MSRQRHVLFEASILALTVVLLCGGSTCAQYRGGGMSLGRQPSSGAGGAWRGGYSGWHGGASGYHNYGYRPSYNYQSGHGYYPGRPYNYGPRWYPGYSSYSLTYPYIYPPNYDYLGYYYPNYAPPVADQVPPAPPPAPVAPVVEEAVARFDILVPADAEVWIDGSKTSQTGTLRRFVTPVLSTKKHYSYQIRAHWVEKGQPVDREDTIRFHGGEQVMLNLMVGPLKATKQ